MSDSSRTQVYYLEETVWGQTPASALKELRLTGESLGQSTQTAKSEEIRSDRQTPDIVRTSVQAEGDVNVELSYGAHDDLIAGALMADWVADVNISGSDISVANADNSYNTTTNDLSGPAVGQWVRIAGFTDPANNGYARVVSASTTKLVVSGLTLADEAVGDPVTIKSSLIQNGTTAKSFTLEKKFADLSTTFHNFLGMRVGSMSLTAETESIVTGSFSFMGKSAQAASATVGTGAPTAAPTNSVLNAIDHIDAVFEGSTTATTLDVTSVDLQIENNLRARPALGVLGASGIGLGSIDVTGSFKAYFVDNTLYSKYLNFNDSSLALRFVDGAGNALIFDLPAITFTGGTVVAGGIDQDIVAEMEFTAKMHATEGKTFNINRIAA